MPSKERYKNYANVAGKKGIKHFVKPVDESFAVGSETRESTRNVRVNLHNLL